MNSDRSWIRWLISAVAVYAAATVVAGVAIFLATGVTETIAAGLAVPVFVLPSIMLYVVLAKIAPTKSWRHIGYLVPFASVLIWMLVVAGGSHEGSGIAALMLVTCCSCGLVAYVLLEFGV